MDGTQRPTNRPRSRSPENQSQIDRQNEMPAAAKNSAFDALIPENLGRAPSRDVDSEGVDE
jgi:hypothetical protein